MNKIFFLVSVFLSTAAIAQEGRVGINTSNPATTLDINGKKAGGTGDTPITEPTGLQAPRLSRAELTAKGDTLYNTAQNGAIVYIKDIIAGDTNAQRANITKVGYYYFDAAAASGAGLWQGFIPNASNTEPWYISGSNTAASSNDQNIYQRGFVGSFVGLPAYTSPSFNFDGAQTVTGLANGFRLTNAATPVAGNGVQIHLEPTAQSRGNTTNIKSIYNGNSTTKSSAFEISSGTSTVADLTLELGADNALKGNLGVGVAAAAADKRPTQKLDVNGNARIRGLEDGTDRANFPRNVVAKSDGTLGYAAADRLTVQMVSPPGQALNLSNVTEENLKDIYVIDQSATINLPNAADMIGRVQKFYIFGGGANVTFRRSTTGFGNIYHATEPSGGYTAPTGVTYSNSGVNTQLNLSGNSYRFRFIEFIAVDNRWFFNHR